MQWEPKATCRALSYIKWTTPISFLSSLTQCRTCRHVFITFSRLHTLYVCKCWHVQCLCSYYRRKYDVIVSEQLTADHAVCRYCSVHTHNTNLGCCSERKCMQITNQDHLDMKAEVMMCDVTHRSLNKSCRMQSSNSLDCFVFLVTCKQLPECNHYFIIIQPLKNSNVFITTVFIHY